MKENKISMRVSDEFMEIVTFVAEMLGISRTEAIVFMSALGYKTITSTQDLVTKYDEFKG